jgi:hypothetical protein
VDVGRVDQEAQLAGSVDVDQMPERRVPERVRGAFRWRVCSVLLGLSKRILLRWLWGAGWFERIV